MDQRQSVSLSRVRSCEALAQGIYDLRLETDLTSGILPGQFFGLYPNDSAMLLPRPVSVCDVTDGELRFVFRVSGKGTEGFSHLVPGDTLRILGPLGNGYPMEELAGKHVALFGGGIGIPPMHYLARALSGGLNDPAVAEWRAKSLTVFLGYRTPELFLYEEFLPYGKILVSCDISCGIGIQGTVTDAAVQAELESEVFCACGPRPMLMAVRELAQGIPLYVSLEERMACGVGACLACVVPTRDTDPHTHVKRARVCADGPVFPADRIDWQLPAGA